MCATGWGVCPKFFDQLCQAMAKSMGIESDEKSSKEFFAALDTDKVGWNHGAAFPCSCCQERATNPQLGERVSKAPSGVRRQVLFSPPYE